MSRCLYCYETVEEGGDFHSKCSMKFFGSIEAPAIPYAFNQMSELAQEVVERSISVPGVQAKLSMSLIEEAKGSNRLTVVGALGGKYIFKPPSEDFPEMPANEHLTMRLAEAFGISVVPSSLIRLESGELSYITKRIDRTESGEKVHMLDMFQILEAFDKYKGSMERVGKALREYSENPLFDKLRLFELTLFCFLTGNNDMHLKNFSMILSEQGWVLAPAYDLLNVAIVLPEDKEELALTLGAKKKKLNRIHFEEFGENLGLNKKQIQSVFKRLQRNLEKIPVILKKSFLSEEMQKVYTNVVSDRSQLLS